jgi:hypothetical protein
MLSENASDGSRGSIETLSNTCLLMQDNGLINSQMSRS